MGTQIINAVKSAFGLIGDLAEMFLQGFSTLVWDATANSGAGALTTFGDFAFTMLSIAIVFGVITLCLGLLRGKTSV